MFDIAREYKAISQGDEGGGYQTVVVGGGCSVVVRDAPRSIIVLCQTDHRGRTKQHPSFAYQPIPGQGP